MTVKAAAGSMALTAGVAVGLACGLAPAHAGEPVALEIPIVADIPYNNDQKYNFGLVTQAMKETPFPFAVHLGDYKSGGAACTAEIDAEFKAWATGFGQMPVFYTPGDNEWTDCDRESTGAPVSELRRLATVRKLMFDNPPPAPETWGLTYQDGLPENAQWSLGGVVYATLNVAGTNNGRVQILKDDTDEALADVEAREARTLAWIESVFARAADEDAAAVVLFQHADPTDVRVEGACTETERQACDGFFHIRAKMKDAAADFAKPVLLVHGDTAPYCMDKSFGGDEAPAFWRLNAAGDFYLIDALRLRVEPSNTDAPFSTTSLLHRVPPADGC